MSGEAPRVNKVLEMKERRGEGWYLKSKRHSWSDSSPSTYMVILPSGELWRCYATGRLMRRVRSAEDSSTYFRYNHSWTRLDGSPINFWGVPEGL
jgi:hypothetical protein